MILICYDGSPAAQHAIAVAHDTVGDVEATIVHVWDPPPYVVGVDPFGGIETWSGPQLAEFEAMALERANRTTEYGVELARNAGFTATGRLERTPVKIWRAIVDVAAEIDATLVVVGARRHSSLESVLLGSVSNALVHHATLPLLLVPVVEAA